MASAQQTGGQFAEPATDGILLLNKPAGLTSNRALQIVKRLAGARKAGHTGSLDPAATGMLPICLGEATKICAFLLEADKTYRVTVRLGEQTDTGDSDGVVIETAPVPDLSPSAWADILERFRGSGTQIPPMYSALRQQGRRLYELARKGEQVQRQAREIRIDDIGLLECAGRRLVFRVTCSKGTYIRVLVEDIAAAAGTVAYTASLHRESVAHFDPADMLDLIGMRRLAESGANRLLERLSPADEALPDWPAFRLNADEAQRFCDGQMLGDRGPVTGLARVYGDRGRFLGIGEIAEGGGLLPRRVFHLTCEPTASVAGQKKA